MASTVFQPDPADKRRTYTTHKRGVLRVFNKAGVEVFAWDFAQDRYVSPPQDSDRDGGTF